MAASAFALPRRFEGLKTGEVALSGFVKLLWFLVYLVHRSGELTWTELHIVERTMLEDPNSGSFGL